MLQIKILFRKPLELTLIMDNLRYQHNLSMIF
jgi:hypothetical protein